MSPDKRKARPTEDRDTANFPKGARPFYITTKLAEVLNGSCK